MPMDGCGDSAVIPIGPHAEVKYRMGLCNMVYIGMSYDGLDEAIMRWHTDVEIDGVMWYNAI